MQERREYFAVCTVPSHVANHLMQHRRKYTGAGEIHAHILVRKAVSVLDAYGRMDERI
jgi:hypothetical protein